MSGFTVSALERRLGHLNQSRQSIRGLSDWLIHHRKHCSKILRIWFKEFVKAEDERKLHFLYLANDIIQNSRKKGARFGRYFSPLLKKTFEDMARLPDEMTKNAVLRLLKIWEDRRVYEVTFLRNIETSYRTKWSELHGFDFHLLEEDQLKRMKPGCSSSKGSSSKSKENDRKHKPSGPYDECDGRSEVPTKRDKLEEGGDPALRHEDAMNTSTVMEFEVDGKVQFQVQLSSSLCEEPPNEDDLIKSLKDLEGMPSTDAITRGEIAELSPVVADVNGVDLICVDSDVSRELQGKVNSAADLLTNYSAKLDGELEDRKKASMVLQDFIHIQKGLHTQAKHRLKKHQNHYKILSKKLEGMKIHILSMPDLTTMPSVDDGLAPLPTAGDLFTVN